MKRNTWYIFSIVTLISLFSSCLTVNADLSIQPDGSGKITMDYRVSKKAIGFQKDSPAGARLITLPVNRQELDKTTAGIDGISILNVIDREDREYNYINSEFNFSSFRTLSKYCGIPIELNLIGDISQLTMEFFEQDQAVSRETTTYLSSFYNEDYLHFVISVPGTIQNSTYGLISPNGRTVEYRISLQDLYSRNQFIWVLEWV
ncbi:MAG: hypothetical protein B6241_09095 [Spirochaetaceae bacterium 4572_59]|nr:MAG: hypothetical protein B6241_09095 [Spirochaetaceae bacterium 4572_59]